MIGEDIVISLEKSNKTLFERETRTCSVLFPMPLGKAYDYLTPDDLEPGTFIVAPFGPRKIIGVVWPRGEGHVCADAAKLKSIDEVLPAARLSGALIDFINWAAGYSMYPLGSVLRLAIRSGDFAHAPSMVQAYVASGSAPEKLTEKRKAALAVASNSDEPMPVSDIASRAGVSDGVVRGLVKTGALALKPVDPDPPFDGPDLSLSPKVLTPDQAQAAEHLQSLIHQGGHHAVLLDGVTGSGKTEVYLEAVAAALKKDENAQVLIMLPEIALTLPFLSRLEERFGMPPAPWHSDLTKAARRRTWRRVGEGQARLVVGARSALFLPFKNLQLIIVDEEHDNAYKQEDGVIYHGRDFAVARGARANFPVVLASATPSLETVVNVDEGRYDICVLSSRASGASMPALSLIDMREDPTEKEMWLSSKLVSEIDANLSVGEQSLLFLNRRGYAPLTLCRKCGHKMTAPDSDTMLVEHRFEKRLVCHHTGFSMPKPPACPKCNAVDALHACGPGVERIYEEVKQRWPDKAVAMLSSDSGYGAEAIRKVLNEMAAGAIDILIATQVVAKGHNFPNLTLVGVVDADMGLAGGDLRAAERTYQLLSQVTGRAGRAEKPGRAFLQTYQPEAPVLAALASGDRDAFLVAEAEGRMGLGYPPYGRLAAVILTSRDEEALHASANALAKLAPQGQGIDVLGPARAPLYRLRGMARMRFLVKARRNVSVQAYLEDWFARVKIPSSVRRVTDINPHSFL